MTKEEFQKLKRGDKIYTAIKVGSIGLPAVWEHTVMHPPLSSDSFVDIITAPCYADFRVGDETGEFMLSKLKFDFCFLTPEEAFETRKQYIVEQEEKLIAEKQIAVGKLKNTTFEKSVKRNF